MEVPWGHWADVTEKLGQVRARRARLVPGAGMLFLAQLAAIAVA